MLSDFNSEARFGILSSFGLFQATDVARKLLREGRMPKRVSISHTKGQTLTLHWGSKGKRSKSKGKKEQKDSRKRIKRALEGKRLWNLMEQRVFGTQESIRGLHGSIKRAKKGMQRAIEVPREERLYPSPLPWLRPCSRPPFVVIYTFWFFDLLCIFKIWKVIWVNRKLFFQENEMHHVVQDEKRMGNTARW